MARHKHHERINEDHCGKLLSEPRAPLGGVRSLPWSSLSLLGTLSRPDITLINCDLTILRATLWNDLCSEYDAENFCKYLETQGYRYSPEFAAFESVWRRDEWNHFLGFRRIFSIIFEEDEDDSTRLLEQRRVNFSPLTRFFKDELSVILVLAYDEIATTKAYAADYSWYKSFGNRGLYEWIKLVTRDESFHFANLLDIVKRNHHTRTGEVRTLLEECLEWDLSSQPYEGTFVLDHEGPQFTEPFLRDCVALICAKLGIAELSSGCSA